MNRQEIFTSLSQNPELDILIIGAGINGIGTFRDLALQGIKVLLIDRADFCSGASAASSHMAHGGIRYLENGEFRLVREAVQERNRLIQNAPHYVKPLPTVIPIFKWFSGIFNAPLKFLGLLDRPTERGAAIIKMGLMMYDAYTSDQGTVPRHEVVLHNEALKRYPQINPQIICTAKYYDGIIQAPERLCIELITDAEADSSHAHALNYVSVAGASGQTVRLRDEVSDETVDVRPKLVINAAGPWIDIANAAMGRETKFIGGTKGSHLVLNHPELRQAIGENEFFFENEDGRIVLICPLLDRVLVGTSDIRIDSPDEAVCTEDEVNYFIGMIAKVFPKITVGTEHVVFTFSGVRPLPASDANSTGQISRDHSTKVIEPTTEHDFPIFNLIGGKWTTFRAFSEQVTDLALERLGRRRQQSTRNLPIGGGREYPENADLTDAWISRQQMNSELQYAQITNLFKRYGTQAKEMIAFIDENDHHFASPLAHAPDYCWGEVAYIVQREKVVHLDDFMLRRASLAMLGQGSQPLLEELSIIMGTLMGWSASKQQEEVAHTVERLATRHKVILTENAQRMEL